MNRRYLMGLWLLALPLLAACGKSPENQKPVSRSPPLATRVVHVELAHREQVWDGVVDAVHQVTLTAQTNARVKELPYDVGDRVKAGDVLVRFTNVEQKSAHSAAQAQIASARAAYVNAEAHYKRIASIYAQRLVSTSDLDQARSARDAAQAALRAAQAQSRQVGQQLDYTVIRAPYDGIVTQRFVQVGEAVQAGPPSPQALIAIESLKDLRVKVQVPQSAIAAIRKYHQAQILPEDCRSARMDVAKVIVYPYADPKTHTFDVRLLLDGSHPDLFPGMTVKAAFAVGTARRLLVPESAIWHQGEVSGVYVIEGHDVSLRQVRTGERFGKRVEVLSGLRDGDMIATDPAAAARYLSSQHAESQT
ncbi:MAG: efflux RND transporter periplasmic adaptor subunit [Oleiagrimonas sp.]|nr:efflux RND transporter periplasmic adaptor subunit [Oleiagrimonas sp.]MDA3913276.1 efflux RND transporter periplasmic adaptor subunit [Oleiagrimonas sp.]